MKKSTKKFTSTFLAAASVAGIVVPATQAFAAEKMTLERAKELIAYANKEKNFAEFNIAYAAVLELKLDEVKQNELLAQLPAWKDVVTADVQTALDKINALGKQLELKEYNDAYAYIRDNVKVARNNQYLLGELDSWGRKGVFSADLVPAVDAVNKVWTEPTEANEKAAQEAIAKVKNTNNVAYLNAELAKAAEKIVRTLKVEAINVLNLREVEVKFNKAVSQTAAEKAANYTFATSTNPEDASLSEDGKTVTLRLATGDALSNYSTTNKLTINKALGFDSDLVIENIAAKDVEVPSALKVEATGPRNLKVTFTEPLDESVLTSDIVASFTLDNGTVALNPSKASFIGRTLTLETYADLTEGSHTLKLAAKNVKDKAGYVAMPATLTFNYVADKTVPTVAIVSSTETTATIKFSKAIDPTTLVGNTNVLFTHTYNTSTNEVNGTAVANKGDNQTFTITFPAGKPFPPGATTLYLKYASDTGTKIADNYGNKVAATTFTVTTTADVTKPEVTGVEFVDKNTVKVTFSENVDATTANDKANYTLKDAAGDVIAITAAPFDGTSKNVVKLTTADINGGSLSLTVKKVKDLSIAQNVMDDVTKTFSATDKVPPTVVDKDTATGGVIDVKMIGTKKVKIQFSEVMDLATIIDKTNYKYDGAALASKDTVEAVDGNKAVIVTIDAGVTASKKIDLARVKDAAGNWMEAFTTQLNILALTNSAPTKVEATGKNSVKLTFDEVIVGATTNDFMYTVDGGTNWAKPSAISVTVVDGKTYVVLTTADIADTKAANVKVKSVKADATDGATAGAKNLYDTAVEFIPTAAGDKYAPKMASAVRKDTDADGKLDTIEVTFSEALYIASVQDTDFAIDGYTITSVALDVASTVVTIKVTEKDTADMANALKVKVVGSIEDASRNAVTEGSIDTTP